MEYNNRWTFVKCRLFVFHKNSVTDVHLEESQWQVWK